MSNDSQSRSFLLHGMEPKSLKAWFDLVTYLAISSTIFWTAIRQLKDPQTPFPRPFLGSILALSLLMSFGLWGQAYLMAADLFHGMAGVEKKLLRLPYQILFICFFATLGLGLWFAVFGLWFLIASK